MSLYKPSFLSVCCRWATAVKEAWAAGNPRSPGWAAGDGGRKGVCLDLYLDAASATLPASK